MRDLRQLGFDSIALGLACSFVLWTSGCATVGTLGELRGQSVLVVVADRPASATVERDLVRALALVPLRLYPGEEDSALQGTLAEEPGRVAQAGAAAERRRVPWLLVVDDKHARVETARGGQLLWQVRLPRGERAHGKLAARLERAVGPEAKLLSAGETRLASVDELRPLRRAAVEARWDDYSAAIDRLIAIYPADPALRSHLGLRDYLLDHPRGEKELLVAATMAPEAESELFALALAADEAGKVGLGVRVRQALVALYPDRLDYVPALAEGHAMLGERSRALALCRGSNVPGAQKSALAIPMGSAPHDFPGALPLADLRFCTGWYLFEGENWEFSALAYEESGDIYSALGRWDELAESYNNSGAAMVQVERPLTAASVLRKAVDIREEIGAPGPLAVSRYNLARALADAGRLSAAIGTYSQSAADYGRAGHPLDALDALVQTLELFARGGELARFEDQGQAIRKRLEALPPSRARDELVGNTWFELGAGRYVLKDHEGAVAAFGRSLRSWEALGMVTEEGQTHYSLAGPRLAMHLFSEAYSDLVRALAVAVLQSDSLSIIEVSQQMDDVERLIHSSGQQLPTIPTELQSVLDRVPRD